jgi:hypothetical protein
MLPHAETIVRVNREADTGCLLVDALRFLSLGFRSRLLLAAQNLFLRKQLALYAERRVRSRRADGATQLTLVVLARRARPFLLSWVVTEIATNASSH